MNIHEFTWISPNGKTHNQIDHILIDWHRHSSVHDVRSFRAADCNTGKPTLTVDNTGTHLTVVYLKHIMSDACKPKLCFKANELTLHFGKVTYNSTHFSIQIWVSSLQNQMKICNREIQIGHYILYNEISTVYGTGGSIWSETNFGPTGPHHPRSSPLPRICTIPSASAIS
jgi:hypothetical protein